MPTGSPSRGPPIRESTVTTRSSFTSSWTASENPSSWVTWTGKHSLCIYVCIYVMYMCMCVLYMYTSTATTRSSFTSSSIQLASPSSWAPCWSVCVIYLCIYLVIELCVYWFMYVCGCIHCVTVTTRSSFTSSWTASENPSSWAMSTGKCYLFIELSIICLLMCVHMSMQLCICICIHTHVHR